MFTAGEIKELKISLRNLIQNPENNGALSQGKRFTVSSQDISILFCCIIFCQPEQLKNKLCFRIDTVLFQDICFDFVPAQAEQEKNFKRAYDLMIKKMIWMNAWYILIQRSFAMLIEESEENS